MAPYFGDMGENLIAERIREEELEGYSVDLGLVHSSCPCVVCRQFPADRDPYPGVKLVAYRDMQRAVAYLAWACSDCAVRVQEGDVPPARVRATVWEWTG
jgi:hypothetical protein